MQGISAVFSSYGDGRKGRVGAVAGPPPTPVGPPLRCVTVDPAVPAASASADPVGCGGEEYRWAAAGPADNDAGMSTVEYAVGTVVAAAFAAVLYKIVTGDSVVAGLTDLINSALSTTF